MSFEDIHNRDRPFGGAHGLIYIGEHVVLAMTRDENTPSHPGKLDLVGGGRERNPDDTWESPFETFQREAHEEVGLKIKRRHIVQARWYPNLDPQYTGVLFEAHLPASADAKVRRGKEGKSVERFPSLAALLAREDFVPVHHGRLADHAHHLATVNPLAPPSFPLEAQIA